MALNIATDLRRAVHEVPPWGWAVVGIGGLYLVLHRARSSGAAAPAGSGPIIAAQDPLSTSDPSGGMSAYVQGLNSGYLQQADVWSNEISSLQQSNADLMTSIGNQQAGGLAGGSSGGGSVPDVPPTPVPTTPPTVPGTFDNGIHPILADPGQYVPVMQPTPPPYTPPPAYIPPPPPPPVTPVGAVTNDSGGGKHNMGPVISPLPPGGFPMLGLPPLPPIGTGLNDPAGGKFEVTKH